jgi:hypothetical protein
VKAMLMLGWLERIPRHNHGALATFDKRMKILCSPGCCRDFAEIHNDTTSHTAHKRIFSDPTHCFCWPLVEYKVGAGAVLGFITPRATTLAKKTLTIVWVLPICS